jgi:hypothetical protein
MDDEDLAETETGTFEDRMLRHAARQTKALESLQHMVWWWSVLAAFGTVILMILFIRDAI